MKFRKDIIFHHIGEDNVILLINDGMVDLNQIFYISPCVVEIYNKFKEIEFYDDMVAEFIISNYDVPLDIFISDWNNIKEHLIAVGIIV